VFAFAEVQVDQALIAADAVLFVHHRVADLEFGEVAQPVVERRFALRIALGAAGAADCRRRVRLR
jgi:hypothetical protein